MSKLSFKKGTTADKKRREIAEAILKENSGISDDKKFAIATSMVKKMRRKKRQPSRR